MKRRSFLAALFAAPIVPVIAKSGEPSPEPFADGNIRLLQDGKVSLKVPDIGEVQSGRIISPSGSFIDLDAGAITIRV